MDVISGLTISFDFEQSEHYNHTKSHYEFKSMRTMVLITITFTFQKMCYLLIIYNIRLCCCVKGFYIQPTAKVIQRCDPGRLVTRCVVA